MVDTNEVTARCRVCGWAAVGRETDPIVAAAMRHIRETGHLPPEVLMWTAAGLEAVGDSEPPVRPPE